MAAAYPHIPYGQADFRRIRLNRWLWVDKTRFVRQLESFHHAVFIRPRRFGKTCWVSLLENYYSRVWAGDFEAVFEDTDLGRAPTSERSRYVVLRFNFSAFNDALPTLERNFEEYCALEVRDALERNPDLFPEPAVRRILAPPGISGKLAELFHHAGVHGIALYMLIDEYDNFANTILAHHGEEAYHSFTHGKRVLPQLLRHGEGGDGDERRGARAAVHHRSVPHHPGRRDERVQHRPQPQPRCEVQRDAGVHRGGGAGGCWRRTATAARSTRTWTRRSR